MVVKSRECVVNKSLLNEQFFLFLQCFLVNQIIESPFVHIFDIISLIAAELEEQLEITKLKSQ